MTLAGDRQQTIADFIAQKILKQPGRVIKPDAPLISSGLIDSLSFVDLAVFVENTFGVRLKNSELNAAAFDTLDQLADLIARKQNP